MVSIIYLRNKTSLKDFSINLLALKSKRGDNYLEQHGHRFMLLFPPPSLYGCFFFSLRLSFRLFRLSASACAIFKKYFI